MTEADQLFFDQIAEAAAQDDALRDVAKANPLEKFQLVFQQALESLFIERMELNEELFSEFMGNQEMQNLIAKTLGSQVYTRLQRHNDR
ncbi:hypothetical protein MIT9_P2049 [Methylomarinovum caldicuralii]|uniref:Uncharacterized protein n=1 Tax=Methylomarinovum caldicuralii TaxID=438856 RepID=A0AAU9CR73_9GAMM|nr:hypothetical protein [Methylomarinovum caldicuralii]BCX82463.1 hypothetical protein MIT9_P2049 [Methylomarinovum caldicuralii]